MKRLLILFTLLAPFQAFSSGTESEISSILSAKNLKNAHYSVYAASFPGEKVVADINSGIAMNPASCIKLLTTAAALKTLGPDYTFPTRFYLAQGAEGTDLYVKGYGDPAYVIERLEVTAGALIKAGLPVDISNIIIDSSYFSDADFPGRQGRSGRAYNALTPAVSLNHSATTIEVFPGERVGDPAVIDGDSPALKIKNLARTSGARTKRSIVIKKGVSKDGEVIVVSGRMPLGSGPKKQHFSVKNPTIHFGETLKDLLLQKGVRVSGHVDDGVVPSGSVAFFEDLSPPLSELIKDMNKQSSNFRAEQITKAMGAKQFGSPGDTEKGARVLSGYLASLGGTNFFIENGSGLSYRNEMSAFDLYLVMKDMFRSPLTKEIFLDSLSIAGVDGTLKKWKDTPLAGRLKGKTGSLNGVSSLAGFLPRDHGTVLFVVFLNGGHVDFASGRRTSQRIAESLLGAR